MAKDFFHQVFKEILLADGWNVTHDPFQVRVGSIGYEIDFGAEKLIAAEKDNTKIAIELKSFNGPSNINEFHKAVGQFNDYFVILEMLDPTRVLYLAVPEKTWNTFFQEIVIKKAIERIEAKIIVYNPFTKKIVQWIN
ncbi:MAG: element excision factor XisH family protein [Saprospiraceae bacterium]